MTESKTFNPIESEDVSIDAIGADDEADDGRVDTDTQTSAAWMRLWGQVDAHLKACQAHPARAVVLLPFLQLLPLARQTAAQYFGQSFLPRLETTQTWSERIAAFEPDALDLSFDAGLDGLRARQWLQRSGLTEYAGVLTQRLVQAAHKIAPLAAARPKEARSAWIQERLAALGLTEANAEAGSGSDSRSGAAIDRYETAVTRIALEWAAASSYASDVLWHEIEGSSKRVDALMIVRGVQANPLVQALAARMKSVASHAVLMLDLPEQPLGQLSMQTASDESDLAQASAACVMAHIQAGRVPVALAAIDRATTRRVSAMLMQAGVRIQDESGWPLSTTRSSVHVSSLLKAALQTRGQPPAGSAFDNCLDWLKHTRIPAHRVSAWEYQLRKANSLKSAVDHAGAAIEFIVNQTPAAEQKIHFNALLQSLQNPRPLAQWLADTAQILQLTGQWQALKSDAAGREILAALHLDGWEQASQSENTAAQQIILQDSSKLSLSEWMHWCEAALEAGRFKPPLQSLHSSAAQVHLLPLAQLAGRPFAALVLAAADSSHLPLALETAGLWNARQKQILGLPSRQDSAAQQQAAWARAMQVPQIDVLWAASHEGAAQSMSPLLAAWLVQHPNAAKKGLEQRNLRSIEAKNQVEHAGSAPELIAISNAQKRSHAVQTAANLQIFSASSYADLRACPYRYFALRLLGLNEAQELDAGVSKRDFGAWLHEILSQFHQARRVCELPEAQEPSDRAQLDACAAQLAEQADYAPLVQEAGFLPFQAAWPQLRESYLLWLKEHESEGWRFEAAERDESRALTENPSVRLKGRLDRIDVQTGSAAKSAFILDYKTESTQSLRERVKNPLEDTQLAFYAALLGRENVQAGYLALAEKEVKLIAQTQINEASEQLQQGLAHDAERLLSGQALPALGEGKVCDYCSARGLCRKDFVETLP